MSRFIRGLLPIWLVFVSAAHCQKLPAKDNSSTSSQTSTSLKIDARVSIEHDQTLLGGERGLDHVGIAVKDLVIAKHTYHELLGFNKPIAGKLPNGIQNINYYFGDATYLETLTYYDREKVPWLANFTDQQSGALFMVLSIYSVEDTRKFLASRKIEVHPPVSGTIAVSGQKPQVTEEKWKTLFLKNSPLPQDLLYFIAYQRNERDLFLNKLADKRVRQRFFQHANTALGIKAVWLAVTDLSATIMALDKIGLSAMGEVFNDQRLGATGQLINANKGSILLLKPDAQNSPVSTFVTKRQGPGIIGLSIQVKSLATAKALISKNLAHDFPVIRSRMGLSILVTPSFTHGIYLEFFENPNTSEDF